MPRHEPCLLPSVFNRLADLSAGGSDSDRWYDVATLTQAVRRDLEDLLNTQQSVPGLRREHPGLADSIIGYGVPDPAGYALETPSGRRQFAAALTHVLRTFEPRFSDVRVEVGRGAEEKLRELHFRIIARLAVETAPQIVFESRLHVPSGQFHVGEEV